MITRNEDSEHEPIRHLYVHIPFCPRKCSYCAFVTHIGSDRLIEPYVDALVEHARQTGQRHRKDPLRTVYFGGGTPTMLTPEQIQRLLRSFELVFGLETEAEITMEGHPDTVTETTLQGYAAAGVTRMSFGAESLVEAELRALGRVHGRQGVEEAVCAARTAGFKSIALDLMYGLPSQTIASWERTLDLALDLGVDHLSLYPLAIEPRTVFSRRLREGALKVPNDERVVRMYRSACRRLARADLEHYEVSNWARDGHRCRHNMAYWLNRPYHALGVGAHTYIPPYRSEHVRRVPEYIKLVKQQQDPVANREHISLPCEKAETTMLRLRLISDGLDTQWLDQRFGGSLRQSHRDEIARLLGQRLITDDGRCIRLPESAVPLANQVWSEFM